MRGPGLRLKNDVRRVWRCPCCQEERRISASIVAVSCACRQPNPQMQLVEPRRLVRAEPPPLPPYFEFEEPPEEESSVTATSKNLDVEHAGKAASICPENPKEDASRGEAVSSLPAERPDEPGTGETDADI